MLRIRTEQIEEIIFRLEVDDKILFKEVVELLKEIKDDGKGKIYVRYGCYIFLG
jgi:Ca2+-binding EF-hand superfamily protein